MRTNQTSAILSSKSCKISLAAGAIYDRVKLRRIHPISLWVALAIFPLDNLCFAGCYAEPRLVLPCRLADTVTSDFSQSLLWSMSSLTGPRPDCRPASRPSPRVSWLSAIRIENQCAIEAVISVKAIEVKQVQ